MQKDFSLALHVPGLWVGSVLFTIVMTVLSPILFIAAIFVPYSVDDIIAMVTGGSGGDPA